MKNLMKTMQDFQQKDLKVLAPSELKQVKGGAQDDSVIIQDVLVDL